MTFKPVGDHILIKLDTAETQSKGGIVIPAMATEQPVTATVVAIGTGRFTDLGQPVEFDVQDGDHIYITRFCGTEIKVNDTDYKVISSDDILGIIEANPVICECKD
jgi:chaperonin GroES